MRGLTDEEAAFLLGLEPENFPTWAQGVVITDRELPDNPIIYANPGFEALTGYDRNEIVGRNCRFLQGPETRKSTIVAIRNAIRAGRRYNGDILNYRRDGTAFWNHLSLGPLVRIERPMLIVGLQRDVSHRHLQDGFVRRNASTGQDPD